ncbi:tannase/feruloyl esterase family alpha/beta hydrolase [Kingella negevensis]|uniref:Tannase and feruloyl esterase n=1 Tax=Kingella negevensis TaxID=1522312 RepID=A0A238HDY7_9NEIS|nr:tannase/feruloyl esterase family alpha/beta hydrolase [Kingella negevensis]MDK4683916.1 tannase/feruloyl esterase family alpha/beta hydrolase [Kingella negevensis]MDK4697519.1 tannase/feruloyl esterase family alpha/beta hydrolase [Kingella negevensis]MDK4706973.1 tannase/feruloyl esterase family alpha/beta hydrolase [Kingella negevensis]MDK4710553.1 tannase/feruloyl esterase family alpha/beta hydrolase [Kingella negevensis]SNB85340.1 Tannase and feruloyl esterase [Kingella negevensis]
MLLKKTILMLSAAFAAHSVQAAIFDAAQCADLSKTEGVNSAKWIQAGKLPSDDQASFTGAAKSAAGVEFDAHCVVNGELEKRTGADGKPYAIGYQMRLPANWNGKFLFQGGGGMDGFVAPAVGATPVAGSTALPALKRGYAVVSMDGGHKGAGDPSFGADQQARLNYAYASTGKVTSLAKLLIRKAYNTEPKHSYFMGCSNGGREAMHAAMRYPTEFDGVVAGNPGFRLSRAAIAQSWDNQHFRAAAPKNDKGEVIFANALTQKDLDAVVTGVLNRCDKNDGVKDGIINAWESCDFKPKMVQDQIGADKVKLLNQIFGGAKNSRGDQIYSGWFYDAGLNTEGWRAWKLGNSQTAKPNARNITLGAASLPSYFMTPYQPNFSTFDFNFDTDVAKTEQIGGLNNSDSTDLSTFKARGGKMIVFEGVSDPVFSAVDLRDWYKQLLNDTKGARDAVRLFNVPGMTHCGGGAALDDFDPLTALEQWHDKGKAPEAMLAQGKAFPNKTQPLCAYPKVATYVRGNMDKASSFVCK